MDMFLIMIGVYNPKMNSYITNFRQNEYDTQNHSVSKASYKETASYNENNSNYSDNPNFSNILRN